MVDIDVVDNQTSVRSMFSSSVPYFSPPPKARNLSHSWIRWTTGHGHRGPRKQSIAMVHYWVRHAECTWSSCVLLSSKGGLLDQISKNAGAAPGETDN